MHLIILDGKHQLTKLIIQMEHVRLLHMQDLPCSCPLLIQISHHWWSKDCQFHYLIVYLSADIDLRTEQLPIEQITPDIVFENVGIYYTGPIYIKYGHVHKPTVVKADIYVFVSLHVKVLHLEIVSNLTSESFISILRWFVACGGKPSLVWNNHGSNFVGAQKEVKEIVEFLEHQKTQNAISQPPKGLNGNLFQNAPHILVVCGTRSRA